MTVVTAYRYTFPYIALYIRLFRLFSRFSACSRRSETDTRESVSTTTFAQVIGQARRHDEEALVDLYQRALPIIYRYVLARLGRPDLVEDVVSEVFLVMVESIGELRTEQEAGFYAWLLQVAQSKVSRALRQVIRGEKISISLPTYATDFYSPIELTATDLFSNPAALHEWRETLEELGLALGSLTVEQQVIVIGRFLAGQKIEELAQALGKQPGAVRVSQFRALKTLAGHLGLVRGSKHEERGRRT